MPIYEYKCRKCQHDFEELVLSSSDKVSCPECGARNIERAMSVFSFSSGGSYRSSSASSCTGCAKSSCGGCGSSH